MNFVILNAPRCGSNMLATVLNSHPDVLCHHEIFNPHVIGYARHLQDDTFTLGTMDERQRDPIDFLGRLWSVRLGRRCVGFKLCERQNERVYRHVLDDTSVKKIILKRRNRVRRFVSLLRAERTGEWVVYRGSARRAEDTAIDVDPAAFLEDLATNDAYYAELEETLRATNQIAITCDFEDLRTRETRSRLLEFLGVPVAELEEDTLPLMLRPLSEVVTNFAELQAALRGTEFEDDLAS